MASYMKKYAYSNAKTEDLWAVLEKETGEPVKDLMTTWTKQKGYPVINAKIKGNDIEIEQVIGYLTYHPSYLSCIHHHTNNQVHICLVINISLLFC